MPPGDPGSGAHVFAAPVHSRGAMALHALRTAVGDRVFPRVPRDRALAHRHGNGTTAAFERLAERVSGKELGGLFQTWLYARGKPNHP